MASTNMLPLQRGAFRLPEASSVKIKCCISRLLYLVPGWRENTGTASSQSRRRQYECEGQDFLCT
jgi:hypothetical protein